jgi:tRNA(Arg) A34 adenosine deaminase TadA
MNNTDLKIIEKAVTLCKKNPISTGMQRVAAIVTDKRGNILSEGINSYEKTHPIQAQFALKTKKYKERVYLHAEISALVKNKTDRAYRIYVARNHRNNNYALAKPCPVCTLAIKEAGIKEIIYTDKESVQKIVL